MQYNEYDARIRSLAKTFYDAEKTDMHTLLQSVLSLISILYSKSIISDDDIELFIEINKQKALTTMSEYFKYNQGDKSCIIANEVELDYVKAEIENMYNSEKQIILGAAKEMKG